jgi:tetratricopeptide (TPR) repeat protein
MADDNNSGGSNTTADNKLFASFIQWGVGAIGSVAGVTGLLFALGFLIVNINLLSYGVYETGLLRERYMSTGIAFLFILSILAAFCVISIPSGLERFLDFLCVQKDDNSSHDRGIDKFVRLLVIFGAPIFISLVATLLVAFVWKISTNPIDVLNFFNEMNDANFRIQRWRNILSTRPVFVWCMLVSGILTLWRSITNWDEVKRVLRGDKIEVPQIKEETEETQVGKGILKFLKEWIWGKGRAPQTKKETKETQVGEHVLKRLKEEWPQILLFTIFFFLILVVYARNVFPALPAAMGGGLPIVVQFSAKDKPDREEMIKLDIPFENGEEDESSLENDDEDHRSLTRRVTLIARTNSNYVLLVFHPELAENVVVSLPKNHVDGIIYYPEEYSLNEEYRFERLIQNGYDALNRGENQTAIDKFKEALEIRPDDLPVRIGLGDAYVEQCIAKKFANPGADCGINEAIERYSEVVLLQECPRLPNSQDEIEPEKTPSIEELNKSAKLCKEFLNNKDETEPEKAHIAEVLYKLSRAYALLINSQVDTEPEKSELEFIRQVKTRFPETCKVLAKRYALLINSQEEKESEKQEPEKIEMVDYLLAVNSILGCEQEVNEKSEDPRNNAEEAKNDQKFYLVESIKRNVTSTLECAIEVDMKSQNPQNYAKEAKSDIAFYVGDPIELRTDDKFIELLFPSMSAKEAVRRLSMEAGDLQELSQIETAIDHYTWAIIYRHERENCKLFEVLNEQHQYYYSLDYRYIRDLAKRCKDMPRIYFNRAGLYLELHGKESRHCEGDECLDKAIANYNLALIQERNNAVYLTSLAGAQRMDSRLEEAMGTYKKMIKLGYMLAWMNLGEIYLIQEENLLARNAYTQMIGFQPGNAAAYYGRAVAEARIGEDLVQAIGDLREAICLEEMYLQKAEEEPVFNPLIDPNDLVTARRKFEAGQIEEGENKLEDAIKKYQESIELDPLNDIYHAALGKAYRELDPPDWKEAEKAYLEATKLSPKSDTYHFKLGVVYAALGKYKLAERSFGKAIEINREEASYHDRLSEVLLKDGLVSGAYYEGEEAVKLEPENLDYRFHLAEIYRQIEVWDRAIMNYDEILKRNPEYGDAYCGLAIVYYQSGEAEEAKAAFQSCQQLSVNDDLKREAEAEKARFEE